MNKVIIAHELGHAVVGQLMDKEFEPTNIELTSNDHIALANCYFADSRKSSPKINGVKCVSDLGGLFGELMWNGTWHPWGASYDLESIASASKNKLSQEIENWMWIEKKKDSFYGMMVGVPRHKRRKIIVDEKWTKQRLPRMWKVYEKVLANVDVEEFKKIVNEIYKSGSDEVLYGELHRYLGRIII